jgi:hypothetical protein
MARNWASTASPRRRVLCFSCRPFRRNRGLCGPAPQRMSPHWPWNDGPTEGDAASSCRGIADLAAGVASFVYPINLITPCDSLYSAIATLGMAIYDFLIPLEQGGGGTQPLRRSRSAQRIAWGSALLRGPFRPCRPPPSGRVLAPWITQSRVFEEALMP